MRQYGGVEFEITFQDGAGPADLELAIIGVPETFDVVRESRAHLGGSKSNRHVFGSRVEAVAWLEAPR